MSSQKNLNSVKSTLAMGKMGVDVPSEFGVESQNEKITEETKQYIVIYQRVVANQPSATQFHWTFLPSPFNEVTPGIHDVVVIVQVPEGASIEVNAWGQCGFLKPPSYSLFDWNPKPGLNPFADYRYGVNVYPCTQGARHQRVIQEGTLNVHSTF